MGDLQLGHADYHRTVAKEARIQTLNRYFEANPALTAGQTALISRPALNRGPYVGGGPIRGTYTQPGDFNDALFVVSGTEWYRVELDGTSRLLTGNLLPGKGSISMAGTGTIGDVPEYMFLADGRNLWLYVANGYGRGTISGSPAANDVVRIGDIYYKFTAGAVDTGAPAGTAGAPWLVARNLADRLSWQSFGYAITANGAPGVDYSTALTAHPERADDRRRGHVGFDPGEQDGRYRQRDCHDDDRRRRTLDCRHDHGGGADYVTTITTPDNVGPISLGYIASYVVVIPAQGEGINGRFWWIAPGETTIDPLDYATAERAPDPVYDVVVFGDQFWLPGKSTTEVWYFTGNPDSPVLRLQGVTFDRGTMPGTALQVKESMVIVDSDGGVFQIAGGLKRISNPSIEQRIREAVEYQASLSLLQGA
jgi:hypothetical protein